MTGREGLRFGFAWRVLLLSLGVLAAVSGCPRKAGPASRRTARDPNVVLAYVCCSLVPAVEAARAQFEAQNEGKSVRIEGGEPVELVRRIEGGKVADLLICPGDAEIGLLEREGYLDRGSRQAIGALRMGIVAPAGKASPIASYEDLRSRRVKSVAMSTPGTTSAGTDAKHALQRADMWEKIQDRLVLHKTPLIALQQVAKGKADAGIVYDPCPMLVAGGKVSRDALQVVAPLTLSEEREARVYAVLDKRSPNMLLAQRFVRTLLSEEMKPVLANAGLLPYQEGESRG